MALIDPEETRLSGLVGQIGPEELPDEALESHPAPWVAHSAGNGHFYVDAANGQMVAHVYCWDQKEYALLRDKLAKVNQG